MSNDDQTKPTQDRKKRVVFLLGVLAALAVVYKIEYQSPPLPRAFKPRQTAQPKPKLKVGAKAPDFELPDKDGRTVKLSSLSGQQPVALWFFSPT